MKKEKFSNTKAVKLVISMLVILGVIVLFKSGISFGHWLYVLLH